MATTTADAIRDRVRTVIEALIPTSLSSDRFRRYRYELGDDFRGWAKANPPASLRRFHVRSTDKLDQDVEVSNTDLELHYLELEIVVAYPQTNRFGGDDALDRDDALDQDRHAIEGAIGLRGAANFASANGFPDATYRGHTPVRESVAGAGVDFLVITQLMSFTRVM